MKLIDPIPNTLPPHDSLRGQWRDRLDELAPTEVPREELANHILGMPTRYWEVVGESDAVWSLEIIHRFMSDTRITDDQSNIVGADWRHVPQRSLTKLCICAWDRSRLLATIAAVFGELQLQIVSASAYTRTDHLVLDMFEVRQDRTGRSAPESLLSQLRPRIEEALMNAVEFEFTRSRMRRRALAKEVNRVPPLVRIDNAASTSHTLMEIEASDRVGLHDDILKALNDCELDILQAFINADDEMAFDTIYLTDRAGEKILDPIAIRHITQMVKAAIISW